MVRGTARFLCWGCVDILARHQVKRSRTTDQAQAVSEFNHGTEHSCNACGNARDDLCTWEGIDWCECCEQWLCDRCYAFTH